MNELTISKALIALGFETGWAVNEHGIILWENTEPQPTETELIAAGWIKPSDEATPTAG
jgi:hypothetical protein